MRAGLVCRKGEGEVLNVLGTGLRFVCRADDTKNAWSAMENELPENYGPPLHQHPWDEAYYVIEGDVEFQIGEERTRVTKGDFVYTPAGMPHAFRGVSKTPARVLIFDAPAFMESYFKELDREVKVLPQDLAKVPEIAGRKGMKVLGPPLAHAAE